MVVSKLRLSAIRNSQTGNKDARRRMASDMPERLGSGYAYDQEGVASHVRARRIGTRQISARQSDCGRQPIGRFQIAQTLNKSLRTWPGRHPNARIASRIVLHNTLGSAAGRTHTAQESAATVDRCWR